MIREVKFESQDRRIKGIIEALNANGIKDIEEANAICEAAGLDPYNKKTAFFRVRRIGLYHYRVLQIFRRNHSCDGSVHQNILV